jgi:hypothetical protein
MPRRAVEGFGTDTQALIPHTIQRGGGGAISSTEETEDESGAGLLGKGVCGLEETSIRRNRMKKLMSTVEELNRAMESFVESVVVDSANPADSDQDDVEGSIGREGVTNGVH